MMMRVVTPILLLLLMVGCVTGCAATSQQTHEDAVQTALLVGVTVQETAVGAYSAIRQGWHQGAISTADMDKAMELYRTYGKAHATYKAAVTAYEVAGVEGNLLLASDAIIDVVGKLTDLAWELGVF